MNAETTARTDSGLDAGPTGTRVKSSYAARLLTYLMVMGPGLIVMEADNDAGAISTYAQAGGQYGLHLLWVLLILLPVTYFIQEMVVRLNGTGKTTLLKQISGWIGADNIGQFVGDGVVMLSAYRRAVSHLCLHDAAILSDTIRENLFAPDVSEEECWLALAAVELDGRVEAAGGLCANTA
jgi:hypothetical protein